MISEAALISIRLSQHKIMTSSGQFRSIWCSRLNLDQQEKNWHIFVLRQHRASLWTLRECFNTTIVVYHLVELRLVWVLEIKYPLEVLYWGPDNFNKPKYNSFMNLVWLNLVSFRVLRMLRYLYSKRMDKLTSPQLLQISRLVKQLRKR